VAEGKAVERTTGSDPRVAVFSDYAGDVFVAEVLPNALVRVTHRGAGSIGVWAQDGAERHGDLTRSYHASKIGRAVADWRADVLETTGAG
jgi:hypothetical protein